VRGGPICDGIRAICLLSPDCGDFLGSQYSTHAIYELRITNLRFIIESEHDPLAMDMSSRCVNDVVVDLGET
jgi:hypothetical protein